MAAGGVVLVLAILGWILPQVDPWTGRRIGLLVLGLANLLAVGASFHRARRLPEEAKPWRVIGLGFLFAVVANLSMILLGSGVRSWGGFQAFTGVCVLVPTFLHPWALLKLRMPSRAPESPVGNLLGAMLFGGSLALLFWILGIWRGGGPLAGPEQAGVAGLCVRAALVGGVVAYRLADDLSRIRGPLGWIFLSVFVGLVLFLFSIAPAVGHPGRSIPSGVAILPLYPLFFAAAALHPASFNEEQQSGRRSSCLMGYIMGVPYLVSAVWLLTTLTRTARGLVLPTACFLLVTTLMVGRQLVLMRELQASQDHLGERVLERTRALEEAQGLLLRTERMNTLGLVGAGLVHDMANSLTVIAAGVDLLSMGEPREEILSRLKASAAHSAALGRRLRGFIHREGEEVTLLELGRLLEEERVILNGLLPAGVVLELDIQPGDWRVLAARAQILQVLVNLVSNARDAILGRGRIRVRLGQDGEHAGIVALAVEDTGCGMTEEVMAHLFEPLFSTKGPEQGTGLGLASIKVIVEQCGGEVQVESSPGLGSTFRVRLPLQEGGSGAS
nr:HAMP domain-containing sensor histidine kinase [uncultured Holophaga sp.]